MSPPVLGENGFIGVLCDPASNKGPSVLTHRGAFWRGLNPLQEPAHPAGHAERLPGPFVTATLATSPALAIATRRKCE